jgi:5'-nucleotidase/UDP-sugar diphosphatase
MERISRRKFLKQSIAVGAGATLMLYTDGSYRIALAQENPEFRLRILHTNDHHARIEPVAGADGKPLHGGVARRKALLDSIRKTNALPTLLLDAGDVFQGTLYFNLYNGQADLEFYNAMGYDAVAIGNHEFDKPQAILADFIKKAKFPVMSANILTAASSPLNGIITPHLIIRRGGKKIGIFALTTEETAVLSNPGPGVVFSPALDAAPAQVKVLRNAGADYVIALTHIGYQQDLKLAETVAGIDLIVGGHSHTPLAPMNGVKGPAYPTVVLGPDRNPVIVTTDWEWGRWLGDLTLGFNAAGRVVDVVGSPTEVAAGLAADPGFENRITVLSKPLVELRARRVGETLTALNGTRNDVRSKETNLGDLVADAMLKKAAGSGAQIAITNGGGIRAGIPAGPVTVGQILEVLPFGNTLALVTITGAQVKQALENGVSQVESGAGRFPQVAGLRFSFDKTKAVGERVTGILFNGAPIDPAASYVVVTNNFMLTGGDGYTAFTAGRGGYDSGFILADVVEEFITVNSPINYVTDGRITEGAAPTAG